MSAVGFRLSAQQRRLIHLQRRRGATLRAMVAARVPAAWSPEAVEGALTAIVADHEILRTTFAARPEMEYPLQVVAGEPALAFTAGEWPSAAEVEACIARWMASERGAGRGDMEELAAGPLVRAALFAVPGDRGPVCRVLCLSAPALIVDEPSLHLILDRVAALCQGAKASPDSDAEPIQYADYAEWSHEMLTADDEDAAAARRVWQRVPDGRRTLRFPWSGRGSDDSGSGSHPAESVRARWTEGLADLRAFTRARGVSVEAAALAAWKIVLTRLCHGFDGPGAGSGKLEGAVLGHVLSGRSAEEIATSIGPFSLATPLPVAVSGTERFADVATGADAAIRAAREGEQSFLTADRETREGFSALFRAVEAPRGTADGVHIERLHVDGEPFALELVVCDAGEHIELALRHAGSVPRAWAERLLGRVQAVLGDGARHPDTAAAGLRAMGPAEEHELLVTWNQTACEVAPACVHERFAEAARRAPDATALVFQGRTMTYGELHARAGALADILASTLARSAGEGAGQNPVVALCMPRCLGLVVGALGILEAGGAFLPIDPDQPIDLIQAAMASARPAAVVTTRGADSGVDTGDLAAVHIDREGCVEGRVASPGGRDPSSRSAARPRVTPADLAYVINTSGSTGQRKSVAIEHGSVINLRAALERAIYEPEFGPAGRTPASEPLHVVMNAPLSVDASIKQLIALIGGHTLHILDEELRTDPRPLMRYFARWPVDVFDCTPSQLELLRWAGFFAGDAPRPRVVLVGGERIDAELWARLAACAGTAFYNVYGPTECTVDTAIARITAAAPEPHVGAPIANARVYVLDEHLAPVPTGARGELCVAGAGLARGYLGDDQANQRAFVTWSVPEPVARATGRRQERIYRTGDVARALGDGTVAIDGRLDDQLKVRGHRVELGEIEAALAAHPHIRHAAVAPVPTGHDGAGAIELRAYVVAEDRGAALSSHALRSFLSPRLPDYMMPAGFYAVDALPLNPSGKLDRKALAAIDDARPLASAPYEEPRDDIERLLTEAWQRVLAVDRVGAMDNFFDLGGHSLLLPQVADHLDSRLGIEVPIIKLIEHPTVRALATYLSGEHTLSADVAAGREAGSRQRQARVRARAPHNRRGHP